ncbi:ABC transporter permease [Spiroplasma cantharicola]|uniref:ABC-2 type transporter transmembrane domain-containing protein n=1 Tax=Spiroplasma cantharicola TaxID=362837 RepID=A0A0M4JK39_9MOLU|nr:ABC transporter permease [Spiroplasma cantharicola]ALD66673.1 hypothetical protein SCANT_v1c07670 [Spiroplasma cantharicola]
MKKSNWNTFKIIFSMQLSNYKKDLFVVFSGWIITTITLVIWLAFKNAGTGAGNKDLVVDNFIVASAIGISVIRNCLFNLVKTIYDFKSSRFLERLFSTKISKTFVFSIIILFNQIVNFLVAVFMFGISMLFSDQRQEIVNVNWPILFLGFFLLAISSNLIALIIVFHSKSYEWASVIANIFYFLPMFLLGLGIPWTLLEQNKPIIIIGFFLPQRYFLNIMASGWANDIGMETNQFGYNGNFWIPYIISFIILVILTIWIYLLLKRVFGYKKNLLKKYPTNLKHNAIIYSIKKANSIEELNEIMEVKKLIIEEKKKKRKAKGKIENANS